MNVPRKHHYTPKFYLRAWTVGGNLIEYSRPRDVLRCKPKSPSATGWQYDLYAFPELPAEAAQHVEAVFLQYADDAAARALENLRNGNAKPWTSELRSAWSRFLAGMTLRHPDAMNELRPAALAIWEGSADKTQREYERIRKSDDPATFDGFWALRDPLLPVKARMNLIIKAFDNEIFGDHVNRMPWSVVDLSASPIPLLTSDRPLEVANLHFPTGLIALPIGPKDLFVAANDPAAAGRLRALNPQSIVHHVNVHVASRARRFVYSDSDMLINFVDRTMSTKMEKLPLFPSLVVPDLIRAA